MKAPVLTLVRGISACMLAVASGPLVMAAPIGAVWPAPGGMSFVNTGGVSGSSALATWDYSAFDSGAFSALYFGLDQVTYGPWPQVSMVHCTR